MSKIKDTIIEKQDTGKDKYGKGTESVNCRTCRISKEDSFRPFRDGYCRSCFYGSHVWNGKKYEKLNS